MSIDKITLSVPTSVAAGTPTSLHDFGSSVAVYIRGTFDATIQLQVSPEPSATTSVWFDVFAPITFADTPRIVELAFPAMQIRANVTAYISGTPLATILGRRVNG